MFNTRTKVKCYAVYNWECPECGELNSVDNDWWDMYGEAMVECIGCNHHVVITKKGC